MESNVSWEEVQTYNRVRNDGSIWENEGNYYYVAYEGTVASWLAVYDLPKELYNMLENKEKSDSDILYKLRYGTWPLNVCGCSHPTLLIAQPDTQKHYSKRELAEILPIAEEQWIYWKGSLPQNYIYQKELNQDRGLL